MNIKKTPVDKPSCKDCYFNKGNCTRPNSVNCQEGKQHYIFKKEGKE
jgi:hypothetical protein